MTQDEWLAAHTFECPDVRGRITPEKCEEQRTKDVYPDQWNPCKKCTCFEERRKGVGMALSQNVIDATAKAMEESSTQEEAAGKLGITGAGLSFRITGNKELAAIAVRKKWRREKKAEAPAPKEEPRKPAKINEEFEKQFTPVQAAPEVSSPETPDTSNEEAKQEEAPVAQENRVTEQTPSVKPMPSESAKPGVNYSENIPENIAQQTPPPIATYIISLKLSRWSIEIPVTVKQV